MTTGHNGTRCIYLKQKQKNIDKIYVSLRLEIGLPPNFYRVEELVKFTFYDLQVPSRAQTIRSKKGLNFQCLNAYKITNIYDPSFIFLHRVALVATWDSTLGSLCYR